MNQKMPKTIVECFSDTEEVEFRAYIRSKGRIGIPKGVRNALGIEEGSLLRCKIKKATPQLENNPRKRKHGMSTHLHAIEKTGRLNDLLLSVVDETMKQVFKETGAKAVYNYLENFCHLRREEIIEKPEIFSAGLERLLSSGASTIEKLILKNLYCKLELKIEEEKGYEFSDYIKELRERFGLRSPPCC